MSGYLKQVFESGKRMFEETPFQPSFPTTLHKKHQSAKYDSYHCLLSIPWPGRARAWTVWLRSPAFGR